MAKLREARGRGNQGDWGQRAVSKLYEDPEHKAHNDRIEAKRQRKLAKRKIRKMTEQQDKERGSNS